MADTPNPTDAARRLILRYFYDRNAAATSMRGKKGAAVKISDVKKELKEAHGMTQQQVVSNLTYLIDREWVEVEEVTKEVRPRGGSTTVPSTTPYYLHRVRIHDAGEHYTTAAELGTPPRDHARQNRMSPAGIEMLYAATDRDTALAETLTPNDLGRVASASVFHLRQELRVVDFDGVPEIPSIFDPDESAIAERNAIGFLLGFRRDLSRPIDRDDRIHIEYVPTQVVCEYLKTRFNPDDGLVHGLAFDSSRMGSGRNWAFFIGHEYCVDPGQQVFFKDRAVAELGEVDRLSVDEALLDRLCVGRTSSIDSDRDQIER